MHAVLKKIWAHIFFDKLVNLKPIKIHVGSRKGSPEYWVAIVFQMNKFNEIFFFLLCYTLYIPLSVEYIEYTKMIIT